MSVNRGEGRKAAPLHLLLVLVAALSLVATGIGAAMLATVHARAQAKAARNGDAAVSPRSAGLSLPAVPASGGYLGVVPNVSAGESTAEQLGPLEQAVGRPFGIVSIYASWSQHPPISGLEAAAASGAIPMVSLHCGPTDAAMISGSYDGLLRADAEAYRAYGGPVLLRWFWEMNLDLPGRDASCLGTGKVASFDYKQAWKHIWNIFHQAGADNVAFVWAPSAAKGAPSAKPYYPGAAYVNWIGVDLLDRSGYGPFAAMFEGFYDIWVAQHKPMIMSETGAVGSAAQAAWLGEMATSVPEEFPQLRAIVYVDATNNRGNYILKPGTEGFAKFVALGRIPFFSGEASP